MKRFNVYLLLIYLAIFAPTSAVATASTAAAPASAVAASTTASTASTAAAAASTASTASTAAKAAAPASDFSFANELILALMLALVVFLVLFIQRQRSMLKVANEELKIAITRGEDKGFTKDKIALNFDLQEVFLYFFKTLAHEASINNNTLLVRQNFSITREKSAPNAKTLTDRIRPGFLPKDLSSQIAPNTNISEHFLEPKTDIERPSRRFFGDYTEVIDAIYAAVRLLSARVNEKLIAVDIDQLSSADNQILLTIEVSLLMPNVADASAIFAELISPPNEEIAAELRRFYAQIDAINSAKCYIKDTSTRSNCAIVLNIPLNGADEQVLCEVAPPYVLKALVVHENQHIARTIINNLNDFNIECVYNKSTSGLAKLALDGVGFPYRAVLIDARLFSELSDAEQEGLLQASEQNYFELTLILNNQLAADLVRANCRAHASYLPLPYTVDNVRSLVNLFVAQHERLLG